MDHDDTVGAVSHNRYDWSVTPPSFAIIEAISAVENTEPVRLARALDTTLFDHVDPEALDTLVSGTERVALSFVMGEYAVEIDGNEVTIVCE
ncbi:HalOD1 output domain-containing protein [Halovivax limisalsi]|uniref:HalOD1 output domain-containing protein n=1 Tax=Halovivax limisalsi TaxID=1453760 RepID=UPI001FFCD835|nr:HalOD1 output domain-containing protein [Halovivax limisalsi]